MKALSATFILILLGFACFGQSKLLKTYGIVKMTETTVKYTEGVALEPYVSEYEIYNEDGKWVEQVDLWPDGTVKQIEKRVYDGDQIVEEIKDQPQDREPEERKAMYEHQKHAYHKGQLISTSILNRDGQLDEQVFFTYNKFGDLEQRRKTDGLGQEVYIEKYTYDQRGFLELRTKSQPGIGLVEEKRYSYE